MTRDQIDAAVESAKHEAIKWQREASRRYHGEDHVWAEDAYQEAMRRVDCYVLLSNPEVQEIVLEEVEHEQRKSP